MKSILREKSKLFAQEIWALSELLKLRKANYSMIDQLLRAASSVGANIHDARYACSTKDFILKMSIAQKECSEVEYWLELFYDSNFISKEHYRDLRSLASELQRMLFASIRTARSKQSSQTLH